MKFMNLYFFEILFLVQKIMEPLDSVTANKSLLVIAHRLSTIANSDKNIVIDQVLFLNLDILLN